MTLFDAIAHGDQEHRDWLKKAMDDHAAGRPVEKPRGGKPDFLTELAVASRARDIYFNARSVDRSLDAGEFGEMFLLQLGDTIKKIDRGDGEHDPEKAVELRERLGSEIAGTLIYLVKIADKAGIDLKAVSIAEFNKLSDQIASPIKL